MPRLLADRTTDAPKEVREAYHAANNQMQRMRALQRQTLSCIAELYKVLSELHNEEAMRQDRRHDQGLH